MLDLLEKLKTVSAALHAEAQEPLFDADVAAKNLDILAEVLTAGGEGTSVTSYEFESSGLLRAL